MKIKVPLTKQTDFSVNDPRSMSAKKFYPALNFSDREFSRESKGVGYEEQDRTLWYLFVAPTTKSLSSELVVAPSCHTIMENC